MYYLIPQKNYMYLPIHQPKNIYIYIFYVYQKIYLYIYTYCVKCVKNSIYFQKIYVISFNSILLGDIFNVSLWHHIFNLWMFSNFSIPPFFLLHVFNALNTDGICAKKVKNNGRTRNFIHSNWNKRRKLHLHILTTITRTLGNYNNIPFFFFQSYCTIY